MPVGRAISIYQVSDAAALPDGRRPPAVIGRPPTGTRVGAAPGPGGPHWLTVVSASVTLPGPDLPHAGSTEHFDGTEEPNIHAGGGPTRSGRPRSAFPSRGSSCYQKVTWHLVPGPGI